MKATPLTTLLSLLLLVVLPTLAAAGGIKQITFEAPFEDWIISKNGNASVKENCGFDGKRSCFALEGTTTSNPMVTSP